MSLDALRFRTIGYSFASKLLYNQNKFTQSFYYLVEKDSKKVAEFICGAEVSRACEGIDTTEKKQPSDNADVELKADASGKRKSQTITIDPSSGKVKKQEGLKDFPRIAID